MSTYCAIVGTFNQEKVLLNRGLLRDCEHFADGSFAALLISTHLSGTAACPGPVLLPRAGAHGGDQHRDPGLRRLHARRHRQARGHRRERDYRGGDQEEPLRGVRAGHSVVAVLSCCVNVDIIAGKQ